MNALLGVTILFLALVITPGWLFYFDITSKVAVLLLGTAAACAWVAVRGTRGGSGREYRIFEWLLAAFAIWLAVSTAISVHPALSAFGTNWRRFGALAQVAALTFAWLLTRHTAGRPERVRRVLRYFVPAAGVTGAYGICQYFGWDPLLPTGAYHVGEGVWTIVRPPGTMGYVSYFATWLVGSAFLCLAVARWEPRGCWRWLAIAAAVLATIAMLLTGTRAAMFALVAGGCALLWRQGARSWRRVAVAGLALAVAGAAFYVSPPGRQMRSRARWFAEDPWGGSRLLLWRDGLRMSAARPATGFGSEVFTAEFPRYESDQLARAYPDFVHESPHNILLDALIAEGLPGLLLLLGICGVGLWCARGHAEIGAAMVAVVVAQQFTVFILPTAVLFLVTVALAVAMESESLETRPPIALRALATAVAAVMAICAVRYVLADRKLELASRSIVRGDPASAARLYSEYDRWRFPGTSAALWYSRAQLTLASNTQDPVTRMQALSQSWAAATRATTESEDPCNAWYNAATLYATQNDFAHTESALRSAIAANPHWFKPHWTLARALALAGRTGEAQREAELAVDLDGGKHSEVSATLRSLRGQAALHR